VSVKRQALTHLRGSLILHSHPPLTPWAAFLRRFAAIRVHPWESVARFNRYRTPFGYTRILLASPVFRRAMAVEKSFIAMRSVMTGCRSSLPLLSSAVI
jgi:hypothetical protein